jgi:hypothetical protein
MISEEIGGIYRLTLVDIGACPSNPKLDNY